MHIFRCIFLSNYWWQESDIWSQASYGYPISWEAFFDPSDSYFLFAKERGYHRWALAHSSSCLFCRLLYCIWKPIESSVIYVCFRFLTDFSDCHCKLTLKLLASFQKESINKNLKELLCTCRYTWTESSSIHFQNSFTHGNTPIGKKEIRQFFVYWNSFKWKRYWQCYRSNRHNYMHCCRLWSKKEKTKG